MSPLYCDPLPFVVDSDEIDVEDCEDKDYHDLFIVGGKERKLSCFLINSPKFMGLNLSLFKT